MKSPVLSAAQLHRKLDNPNLIILDCSPQSNMSGLKPEFQNTVIQNARYFDIEEDFSDLTSGLPHTLPSPEQFQENCRKLGLDNSSEIVVYDNLGIYTSPRVWWMFRVMGHEKIAVLDGGLSAWVKAGFPTQTEHDTAKKRGNFTAHFQPELVSDIDFVKQNLTKKEALIIDARSRERFNGTVPEPREGVRSGNIPGSVNIPFEEVLKDGKFKEKEELRSIFKEVNDPSKELVFSCGSGVTACILFLAGELVIDQKKSVYDGSWAEWGSREENS
ncbi:sulfurtransferase [Salinimicrobium sediminilitoris]|uniref:sulfurtransferase n=1 Tax=Salinimicrobium sediminilitoris TaxID=2876715 RepID=UPI001E4B353D|nr:sulfurtransferase [Salinimicrobium sediminilitoris]MCC8359763.1 sulfurtransferase [Salinimicrobium sediminilitoris]